MSFDKQHISKETITYGKLAHGYKKATLCTFQSGNSTRHDLVEDVVRTFQRLLGNDTGLLQQIWAKTNTQLKKCLEIFKSTYKFQCQHQPIYQWGQSGYGWIYPICDIWNIDFKGVKRQQLTKREELSLRTVLALPKASSTGLVCTTWSSRVPFFCCSSVGFLEEAPTVAK